MDYHKIVNPLLGWYDQNKRILPWREDRNPYKIWVSEIMLQQTRVEAVKPYYDRFLDLFPKVTDLANASEEQLLKSWEGLGYYNRIRNLNKAAGIVRDEYKGKIPNDYAKLLALPGIGSYTAGAVASIAFGIAEPAVDGNVLRIITRISADQSDILSAKVKKKTEDDLRLVMPKDRPGDFNQSLMELGATVCIPNGMPKCTECPLYEMCETRKQELFDRIPFKKPKKKRVVEPKTVLIIRDGDKTLIRKRDSKGLLAGLYEFPTYDGYMSEDEIKQVTKEYGYRPLFIKEIEEAVHIFSHKEWHMKGYLIKVEDSEEIRDGKHVLNEELQEYEDSKKKQILILPEEIEKEYPIPSAFKAYTKYVGIKIGMK